MAISKCSEADIARYQQARLSRDPRFDGHFFVAVKSTGIFCRPICPAPLPAEKNVSYFDHAIGAIQAGYRPCLRCRPDSAPMSPAWLGAKTTLIRAQKLLSEFPPSSIVSIASRLGISERYLHAMVKKHTGYAPKQFQDVQRVLFAKQLLQQSDLSIETIAYTAGYESVRQLQRASKQFLKFTPSALRKRMAVVKEDQPCVTLRVPFRPPYNHQQVFSFLSLRAIQGIEEVTPNSYARHFCIDDVQGHIKAMFNAKGCCFDIEVKANDMSVVHKAIAKVKDVLDINADPMLIEQAVLASGVDKSDITPGLRLPRVWSLFESGCRAILGQQVSVKAAINHLNNLVVNLGHEQHQHRVFPTPTQVAESDLGFLKMPMARKQALRDFAALCCSNASPSNDEILAIKGIGPWTVDYLAMRGRGDPDIYLEGDLIVRKVAAQYELNPEKAAPWRSYLTLQLWQRYNEQLNEK